MSKYKLQVRVSMYPHGYLLDLIGAPPKCRSIALFNKQPDGTIGVTFTRKEIRQIREILEFDDTLLLRDSATRCVEVQFLPITEDP